MIGPLTFSDIYTILHSVALFVENCRNRFLNFKSVVHFLKFEIQFLIRKCNTLTVLHQNKENPFSPLFVTQINSFFLRFWPFHVFLSFFHFFYRRTKSLQGIRLFIPTYRHTFKLYSNTNNNPEKAISTNISWYIVEQRKDIKNVTGSENWAKKGMFKWWRILVAFILALRFALY